MDEEILNAFLGAATGTDTRSRIEQRLFPSKPEPVCVVIDGAMGTELERRGFEIGTKAMWASSIVVEDPLVIAAVHTDFLSSGCEIISTCTYQSSVAGCTAHNTTLTDFASLAMALAHAAVDTMQEIQSGRTLFVAGSLGPLGSTLPGGEEFKGQYTITEAQAEAFHSPRILALLCPTEAALGRRKFSDLLLFETFPRLDEAVYAARLLDRHNADDFARSLKIPPRPCFVTFTSADGRRGCMSGEAWPEIVARLSHCKSVIGIGVSCVSPRVADAAVEALLALKVADCPGYDAARSSPIAIVVYPNSGEVFDGETHGWKAGDETDSTAHSMTRGQLAAKWWAAVKARPAAAADGSAWALSATLVCGGCCRTQPEDIRDLIASLEGRHH